MQVIIISRHGTDENFFLSKLYKNYGLIISNYD